MAKKSKKTEEKKPDYVLFGVIGGIVAILLILIFWFVGTYNYLVTLNTNIDKSWAQVENQYQRRVDLIPNLVNTVKGAANFEQSTLEDITKLRSQWQTAPTVNAKVQTANQIESAISKIIAVAEAYPQLTATQNFKELQVQLEGTENRVATERGRFNEAVGAYNIAIQKMPSNIIAGMFGYAKRVFFEAKAGAENAPEVKF